MRCVNIVSLMPVTRLSASEFLDNDLTFMFGHFRCLGVLSNLDNCELFFLDYFVLAYFHNYNALFTMCTPGLAPASAKNQCLILQCKMPVENQKVGASKNAS